MKRVIAQVILIATTLVVLPAQVTDAATISFKATSSSDVVASLSKKLAHTSLGKEGLAKSDGAQSNGAVANRVCGARVSPFTHYRGLAHYGFYAQVFAMNPIDQSGFVFALICDGPYAGNVYDWDPSHTTWSLYTTHVNDFGVSTTNDGNGMDLVAYAVKQDPSTRAMSFWMEMKGLQWSTSAPHAVSVAVAGVRGNVLCGYYLDAAAPPHAYAADWPIFGVDSHSC